MPKGQPIHFPKVWTKNRGQEGRLEGRLGTGPRGPVPNLPSNLPSCPLFRKSLTGLLLVAGRPAPGLHRNTVAFTVVHDLTSQERLEYWEL